MSQTLQVKIDFNSNLHFAVELTLLDKARGWEVRHADDCGFSLVKVGEFQGIKCADKVVYVTSTVVDQSVYPTMVIQQAGRAPRLRESRLNFNHGLSLDEQAERLTQWVNHLLEMDEVKA